jgi:hypothetical protein
MGCCSGYMGEVGVDLSVAPTDEAHGRGRGQGVVPDHDGMWGSVSSGPRLCVGGYIRAVLHGVGVAPGSHNGISVNLAGTGVPQGAFIDPIVFPASYSQAASMVTSARTTAATAKCCST